MRRIVAATIGALVLMTGAIASRPAAALTPTELFVTRAYDDFLLREPTSTELADAAIGLGSGTTRTVFVRDLIRSQEFRGMWIAGVWQAYVENIPTGTAFDVALWNLTASNDYLAVELDVLASSTFFTREGSTNAGFVQGVYREVLNRVASATDEAFWIGQIVGGSSRLTVARQIIRGPEASARRVRGTLTSPCETTTVAIFEDTYAGSYCLVLDRVADSSGAAYWTGVLQGNGQLPDLWSSLAGSTEYYNLAQS